MGEEGATVVRGRLDMRVGEFAFRPAGDDKPLALAWGMAHHVDEGEFDPLFARALKACEEGGS